MTFFVASDHGGYEAKRDIIEILKKLKYEVVDLGCKNNQSVDYPDYAKLVCQNVLNTPNSNGILICGTGIGMSITANRHKGIRAALCHNGFTADITKKHNNSNVLCIGARVVGKAIIEEIIHRWCNSKFEAGRHQKRVDKI